MEHHHFIAGLIIYFDWAIFYVAKCWFIATGPRIGRQPSVCGAHGLEVGEMGETERRMEKDGIRWDKMRYYLGEYWENNGIRWDDMGY
jgi:hypothetical protein